MAGEPYTENDSMKTNAENVNNSTADIQSQTVENVNLMNDFTNGTVQQPVTNIVDNNGSNVNSMPTDSQMSTTPVEPTSEVTTDTTESLFE